MVARLELECSIDQKQCVCVVVSFLEDRVLLPVLNQLALLQSLFLEPGFQASDWQQFKYARCQRVISWDHLRFRPEDGI